MVNNIISVITGFRITLPIAIATLVLNSVLACTRLESRRPLFNNIVLFKRVLNYTADCDY